MPLDNQTPLIQRIARQAYDTFKGFDATAVGDEQFVAKQGELLALVTAVRAADLNIEPRKRAAGGGSPADTTTPPVTYMHICETDAFSMGVFLLRSGASIPLHDHPCMYGMLKVLYGKVSIRCFDKLEQGTTGANFEPPFEPPVAPCQKDSVRRCVLRPLGEYSADSGPCLLTPLRDNLHRIDALDGPAAFLDILAPPYDSDDGRDCHYYRVLNRAETGGPESKHGAEQHDAEEKDQETETWLLEIPQPEDFWCGGESYRGPNVSV
ncbi:hypothetical protein NHX12_024614 [Muraenolepis orangiensis]|uniref:2-aminoethanethiol dioxygenase n=1 Tax=Muraenolepis orangiensis TaxID=630683 RepID=A0A9Q0ELF0_9TELE|nr:hypothetical protein NHX12_024614 [Muraenolepis orangiensis]